MNNQQNHITYSLLEVFKNLFYQTAREKTVVAAAFKFEFYMTITVLKLWLKSNSRTNIRKKKEQNSSG